MMLIIFSSLICTCNILYLLIYLQKYLGKFKKKLQNNPVTFIYCMVNGDNSLCIQMHKHLKQINNKTIDYM